MTVRDVPLSGKKVLLRCDFNVPQDKTTGEITSDKRIVAALLEKQQLKEVDLARARRLQEETGGGILLLLSRLGLVSERDHAEANAHTLGLRMLGAKDMPAAPPELLPDAQPLSVRFLRQFA